MINPAPAVTIDGVPVIETCAHLDARGLPALSATAPTVLGDLLIRWGRADSWETPPPAVLSVELFDPAGALLHDVVTLGIAGRAVEVTIPTPTGPRCLFSGRISAATATEDTVRTTTGDVIGWRIVVTAADWRAANAAYSYEFNSLYTVLSQVAAGIGYLAPHGGVPSRWMPNVTTQYGIPLETFSMSGTADDILATYAAHTADYHQYNPDIAALEIIPTARLSAPFAHLAETNDGAVTIRAGSVTSTVRAETWTGTTLPGDGVARAASTDVELSPADRITSVQVTYISDGDPAQVTVNDTSPGPLPRPRVTYDLHLMSPGVATTVANVALARAMNEARGPHHPPIEYRTDATGGFESWAQALAVLKTWETPQPVALTGSPWTRATGAVLAHTVLGGEVRYSRGHWRVLMRLRRTASDPGPGPSWSDLAPTGIEWGRPPAPARRFQSSVVWADLAAGVATATVLPAQE